MSAQKRIPLHDLREITNGFSVDSRIGQGGYGDVYKGVYNGREVAVKLLHVDTVQGIDDQQYLNEVGNLLRVKHQNILQLLGYSYETTSELVEHNGKQRFSQHIYRVLCFEYLQGGSLDVYLREGSFAPDWSTRYMIIKGICEGLDFLHRCEPPIFHLDLKPANILLDSSMVPKVADFGLSRVISQSHTQVTKQKRGTKMYMPPEFINGGHISHKNDVYSLGLVMIDIMTGSSSYSSYTEMDEVLQFKQKVLSNWKNRIKATSEYPLEESHQVQTCIDTAMRCMEFDRNNRPTIAEVLDILNKTETHIPKRQLVHDLKTKQDEPDNITNKHFKGMPKDSFNINVQQVPNRETSSDVEQISILRTTEEKLKTSSMTKDTSMDRCEELHQLQMDRAITLRNELESMLTDESAEPKRIPLSLLELITNGFADDEIIGYGGFARVYKGMLVNGTIAVKKLVITVDIDENNFIEEVRCLMNAKHKNIVRFLGYCSESQGEMQDFNGQFVLAELRQRVLCFEYLSEGSLEKKINDASCGLEWSTRYEIIDGICAGLYYLHRKRIVHLDLKPANILLDHNMMPKIADFGLSRRFCEDQSKIITSKLTGTIGYMAPEFWGGQITLKCDLYSLGIIIIEILTGAKGCPNIDDVCESWINRLEKTERETQLVQLRVCTEIAIECTDFNPVKRPDIEHIIDKLRAAKSAEESAASSHKGQESF